jgi:glyoxylase-like metal-dependent hydrolase (beta-lactamase superfamily II)
MSQHHHDHSHHHHHHSDEIRVGEPIRLAPGVLQIDTLLGEWERMTAGYLIEGTMPVLVETGAQSSAPVVLESLRRLGLDPKDLAGIVVTHIHLDHAGGVGDVAAAYPNATVYVHEKGARHLVDPSKLIASASLVYGELLDSLYGRMDATPQERVHVLDDEEEIALGKGRVLRAIDSPGHAKHHIGLLDSDSGILFAGDAVGVKLPDGGRLRPSTPPPDFNMDQALVSLAKFGAHHPSGIALAHYGLLNEPDSLLAEAATTLQAWVATAEAAWREGRDIAQALADEYDVSADEIPIEYRDKLEVLNGFHSNAAGMRRYFEKRIEPSES